MFSFDLTWYHSDNLLGRKCWPVICLLTPGHTNAHRLTHKCQQKALSFRWRGKFTLCLVIFCCPALLRFKVRQQLEAAPRCSFFSFVMTNLSQLLQCQQSASTSLLPLDEKSQELMWEVIVWRHFQDSRLGFYEWRHEDSRVKVILKTCCGFCLSVFNETLEWKQHQLKDLKTFHRNFEEAQSFQQDWKNMTTIINTIMKRNSNKHRWILEASNFNFIQMSTKMNVLVKTACYPTIILMAK